MKPSVSGYWVWLSWTSALGCLMALGCSTKHSSVEYASQEHAKYCQFGDQFVEAWRRQDWDEAYRLCSRYMRSEVSHTEFRLQRLKDVETYGAILQARPIHRCEIDANLLRGPKHIQKTGDVVVDGFNLLDAQRSVGDVPDSIPFEIRRAALQAELSMDPRTIKGLALEYDVTAPDLEVIAFLNIVLVEESGGLAVGHIWLRWPDMAD